MSEYSLDVNVAVRGDGEAKERLKALERFMESVRTRAAALNRLKISPALAVDDRISSPLRSVRADLERTGGMYVKVFRNAGAGVAESIKPVLYSITDWFDFCRSKVDWWKNGLILAGRAAAERVLSEFQRAYAKIRKMLPGSPNMKIDVSEKMEIEHRVIHFINILGSSSGGQAGGKGEEKKSFWQKMLDHFSDKAAEFPADFIFDKIEDLLDKGLEIIFEKSARKRGQRKSPGIENIASEIDIDKGQKVTKNNIDNKSLGSSRETVINGSDKKIAGGSRKSLLSSRIGDIKAGYALARETGSGPVQSVFKAGNIMGETTPGAAGRLFSKSKALIKRVPFLSTAVNIADIATSDDPLKSAAKAAAGYAGAAGGAQLGATIGTFILPGLGTLIGGALGGLAGSIAGEWAAGKAVDTARGDKSGSDGSGVGDAGSQSGLAQNFNINVTVDSDMSKTELAQFVAERIAAEIRKITQNTTPSPAFAGGGR